MLAEPVVGVDHLASADGDRPARPQLDREEPPDGFGVEQPVAPRQRNVGCEDSVWQRASSLPPRALEPRLARSAEASIPARIRA